jgi:hypothetical protein
MGGGAACCVVCTNIQHSSTTIQFTVNTQQRWLQRWINIKNNDSQQGKKKKPNILSINNCNNDINNGK